MMAWDMTWSELGNFFGSGFLNVFGTPILMGFFFMVVLFYWTKDLKLTLYSMLVLGSVGLILLSSAGYLPSWVLYITLITVATLAGVVVMTWLS